jgi:LPS sulfotransferase NodH
MFFYLRKSVTPFVILFEGRTGSSYLVTSISKHPNVRAGWEELVQLKPRGHEAQAEWADKALTAPLIGRFGAVGFKTKLRDIADPTQFSRLLRERNVKIVHMQRRNRVKVAISEINCNVLHARTGSYNVYKEDDRLPPIRIDVAEFKNTLAMREQLDSDLKGFVDDLHLPTLDICYENILLDEPNTLKTTYEFIGVTPRLTKGASYKNTNDDLRNALLNFEELKASVSGTPYEDMFDEVLVNKPRY